MTNWQPIETAPQDGTYVLCAHVGQMWVEKCWYDEDDGIWYGPGAYDAEPYTPTHWMPVPEPPK